VLASFYQPEAAQQGVHLGGDARRRQFGLAKHRMQVAQQLMVLVENAPRVLQQRRQLRQCAAGERGIVFVHQHPHGEPNDALGVDRDGLVGQEFQRPQVDIDLPAFQLVQQPVAGLGKMLTERPAMGR
jgi:hypothetical protein